MSKEKLGKYISLQEATKHCNYSQEYLSLRARQGRLKAVKIGRNWVTKGEWLEEYLGRVEEHNNSLVAKRVAEARRKALPPENLPIGEFDELAPARLMGAHERLSTLRFGFTCVMISLVLVAGSFFAFQLIQSKFSLESVTKDTPSFLYVRSEAGDIVIREVEDSSQNWVIVSKGGSGEAWRHTMDIFKGDIHWLGRQISVLAKKIKEIPRKIVQRLNKSISRLWEEPEKVAEEEVLPSPGERKGMVVIPSTGRNEEVKEEIKAAFSDEVRVEPEDKTSGIIIPIFKKGEGEEYMYVLVPTKK